MNNLELNHLKYFYFTVLEGGVAQAAQRLHVQQPVVSKMLKNLEENLERPLFWKKGRSKSLTDYGQLMFRHCQVVFNELNRMSQISNDPKEVSGVLNIGGAEPVVTYLYPEIFSRLMENFPNLNFNVHNSTQSNMLKMLQEGRLDIGCLFYLPKLLEGLEVFKKVSFPFSLVIKKSLREDEKVIQSFIGSREIDDTSTKSFPTVELMRKNYPDTRIVFSSNNISLHKELVLRGKGVSILPSFMVEKEIKKGELVELYPEQSFKWDLLFVKRKSDHLNVASKAFSKMW